MSNFSWANEIRHQVECLAAQHSAIFRREGTAQAASLREKFELEEPADAVVLHEYPCALLHAEGSSKGKLYLTQRCICFSGSLFGKDTRCKCFLPSPSFGSPPLPFSFLPFLSFARRARWLAYGLKCRRYHMWAVAGAVDDCALSGT